MKGKIQLSLLRSTEMKLQIHNNLITAWSLTLYVPIFPPSSHPVTFITSISYNPAITSGPLHYIILGPYRPTFNSAAFHSFEPGPAVLSFFILGRVLILAHSFIGVHISLPYCACIRRKYYVKSMCKSGWGMGFPQHCYVGSNMPEH